ncbi:MAG: class I SAM-dependent methyltransferase [Rhodobacteraceae bacterium]|nr:class I SAM-dependent methyltransferase [Paracoccaceae bacterium]
MLYDADDMLQLNFPVEGTFDLINATKRFKFNSVLDIGFGSGGASLFYAVLGKSVDAIGLEVESYDYPKALFNSLNISVYDTSFEDFEPVRSYDAIWASHVLEHNLNTGLFLEKVKRLLNDDGWLFIMVPPYKDKVVGGHVTNGWNLGQLMYVLLVAGFDIKFGHFVRHGYSLCAFVQKSKKKLPKLRMDIGDIEATSELWPIDVKQGFDGKIDHANWFIDFECFEFRKKRITELETRNKILSVELQRTKEALVDKENSISSIIESVKEEIILGKEEIRIKKEIFDSNTTKDIKFGPQTFGLAKAAFAIEEFEVAAKLFELCYEHDAERPNLLRAAAEAYVRVRKNNEAIKCLERAREHKKLKTNKRLKYRLLSLKYPPLSAFLKGAKFDVFQI